MATSKPSGRFVPTLTEVVRPGQAAAPTPLDRDRLVEQVLQTVKPRLEQQLRASLQALVEQHMKAAAPRMQQDIEEAVNLAVALAMARMNRPKK